MAIFYLTLFPLALWYGWRCYRPSSARAMFEIARSRGFEVCTKCGYWLRGLGEDVEQCPECGAAREAMPASAKSSECAS